MSLESIFRVVSHAHQTASQASGGTVEEKGAIDVLGGLSALLEARIQLHRAASVAPASTPAIDALKPKLPVSAAPQRPATAPTGPRKQPMPTRESGDSYDLK